MFGVAVFVDASLSVQLGAQAILATVRFIRNHHDVAALIERRMALLTVQRRKLLHGGKDDAGRIRGIKQLAQLVSVIGPVAASASVNPVPGRRWRITVRRDRCDPSPPQSSGCSSPPVAAVPGIAAHGDTFAGTLGMPDDARFFTAGLNITAQRRCLPVTLQS
ncbi:Uncharacterised protein [Salmonella enterica subsp. enterica]|nr:Uncharacterised protein [Salmonella enterica subsp. enterica] [Salmonella enterica subsp. enterica serovar Menston]